MAVRREAVRLDLEDHFTSEMLRAAAATQTLDKALGSLSGSAVRSHRGLTQTERGIDGVGRTARRSSTDIDRYSGRLRLLIAAAAAVGPAVVPITAVAVPAVTGLAAQLGFAAVGMSSLVVASQGVGDALKAVNDAALEPTAENLEKARIAMERIGPEAQVFVSRFQELRPVLTDIRDAAAAGWFPGLTESLDHFERVAPRVASIFEEIGRTGGNLVSEGARALSGPQWSEFLSFIERSAPQALDELGRTVGNLARGMAELWMAFDPLNDDFSQWLLNASRGFAEWSAGLSATEGFQEFVAYIRANGPKVAEAAGAIANALIQIIQAAAPIGGPVLEAITSLANALAAIADSPIGTPLFTAAAAMGAMTLAAKTANAAVLRLNGSMALLGATSKGAAGAKGLAGGAAGVAFGGLLANDLLSNLAGGKTGDVNLANSSPINALNALVQWDPDKFVATDILKRLVKGPDEATESVDVLAEAQREAQAEADRLADAQLGLTPALQSTAASAGISASNLRSLATSTNEASAAAWGAFDAQTNLGAALDAVDQAASKGKRGISETTEAGRENRAALSNLASAWSATKEAMEANGAPARRIEGRYREVRGAVMRAAEGMGLTRAEARRLADQLDKPMTIVIKSEHQAAVASAKSAIDGLRASIQGKPIIQTIQIQRQYGPNARAGTPGGLADLLGGADGATVPGLDDGGTIRGRRYPYGDKVLMFLAPGEEVISNRYGQADRHRDLLKAINANRMATGGTVGGDRGGKGGDPFPGLPNSLKALRRELRESTKAVERERRQRDAVVDSMRTLKSSVTDKLQSDLFGPANEWASAGLGFEQAMGILTRDIQTASGLKRDTRKLRRKGLDGMALDYLLANADEQVVGQFADQSRADLARFERQFERRASLTASAGSLAAQSAYGADRRREERQHRAELKELRRIEAAIRQESRENRKSRRKGARSAARSRRRGDLR